MAATTRNLRTAQKISALEAGAVAMNEAIDLVLGGTATLLTKPAGATVLVMKAEVGSFQVKPGDYVSAFPAPVATTTDTTAGNATWGIATGETIKMAAPDKITVKGVDGSAALKYYWQ